MTGDALGAVQTRGASLERERSVVVRCHGGRRCDPGISRDCVPMAKPVMLDCPAYADCDRGLGHCKASSVKRSTAGQLSVICLPRNVHTAS